MSANKLTSEVLQEMIVDRWAKEKRWFATEFDDGRLKGESPVETSARLNNQIYETLSEPLKAMQVDYLNKVDAQCYKEKHLSDAMPNAEQVKVCADRIHKKIFGTFYERM